eukprot:4057384-Pyramimonas_sp.AAC.1
MVTGRRSAMEKTSAARCPAESEGHRCNARAVLQLAWLCVCWLRAVVAPEPAVPSGRFPLDVPGQVGGRCRNS